MAGDLEAPEYTQEELDTLAEITFEDIDLAKTAWERDAPPRYRGLLDAEIVEVETDEDNS